MSWSQIGGKKPGPKNPLAGTMHQTHPVLRSGDALTGSNISVRHPALPGPSMMAAGRDHAELPNGSPSETPAGGINGGLAPFQRAKGKQMADFNP